MGFGDGYSDHVLPGTPAAGRPEETVRHSSDGRQPRPNGAHPSTDTRADGAAQANPPSSDAPAPPRHVRSITLAAEPESVRYGRARLRD